MGLIAISERDLQRIEDLSKVVERRMTIGAAAHILDERECCILARSGSKPNIRLSAVGGHLHSRA
jgi:formylmethanofuran dehydrogenase subunit A